MEQRSEDNDVTHVEKDVPAALLWSIAIYDADTRWLIHNRDRDAKGKATVGNRTPGLRNNADGSRTCVPTVRARDQKASEVEP